MINRILIRIKVIQLLYSYLLIEKDFSLENQPTPPTKEKRFAYALYMDILVLMAEIARKITRRGGGLPLYDNNRFIRNVEADEKIRSLRARYNASGFPFEKLVEPLAEKIKESGIYKNYLKKKEDTSSEDVQIWKEIFNQIIAVDTSLQAGASLIDNYSMRGLDRMRELMNDTFTRFLSSQVHVADAVRQLEESLDKARELYFRLLLLPIELVNLRELQIQENMQKYIPTDEDRNPNMRFVENEFVLKLREVKELNDYAEKNKISMIADDRITLENLLKAIMESDVYKEYMNFPATDFAMDCDFWRNLYKHVIFSNEDFLEALEDKSVFWNDDLQIIGTFVIKTLKRLEEGQEDVILDKYKDEEDARFGKELFIATVKGKEEYRTYINEFVNKSSWDTERLAFMDVVITETAIAELLNFPKIPTSVTVNEYIELAKSYSTSKSGAFVHGLLGAIIARMREEGKLLKE